MPWPGYELGKTMPDPILDEILKVKADAKSKPAAIITANGCTGVEDFAAGATVFRYFTRDEVDYVLQGKAEMVYSLAGTSHTEQKTMTAEAGEAYVIPWGARVTWKVVPGSRFRRVSTSIPGFAQAERKGKG